MIRWTTLIGMIALTACGSSHSTSDGGTDAATDVALDVIGCPPVLPETCVRGACCEDERLAERVGTTCTFRCREGWVEQSLCDPELGCGRFDACADNSDCTLATNSCCGPCGRPSLSDFDAINSDRQDAHRTNVCPVPEPCPGCPVAPNPYIGATCDVGTCRGFDLETLPATECTTPLDCRVRARECCECGADVSPFSLIALRPDAVGDYERLVCDETIACLECAPVYPPEAITDCVAGRCVVTVLEAD